MDIQAHQNSKSMGADSDSVSNPRLCTKAPEELEKADNKPCCPKHNVSELFLVEGQEQLQGETSTQEKSPVEAKKHSDCPKENLAEDKKAFEKIMQGYQKKFNFPKWMVGLAKSATGFSHDKHWSRWGAVFNEIAEAVHPTLHNLLPAAANPVWYSLWAKTIGYLGIRNVVEGLKKNAVTASIKKGMHDLLAAVTLPVIAVRVVNWLQNGFFKALGAGEKNLLTNIIRPVVSILTAKKAIGFLDPRVDKFLKKYIFPVAIDPFKKTINDKVGTWIGNIARMIFKPAT